jgi:hypothetical protein
MTEHAFYPQLKLWAMINSISGKLFNNISAMLLLYL